MNYYKLAIPAAIVLAGTLISGTVIYSFSRKSTPQIENGSASAAQSGQLTPSINNIRSISDKDHILGNLSAPIKIVEYSDTECPFCRQFHPVMHQIVADYGSQVAWIYRHFPLHNIHPKAIQEAEATECAAELGGNNAFWKYLDRLFEIRHSDVSNFVYLLETAEYAGLEQAEFKKCFEQRKHAERVADDYNDAVKSGGRGTPYSIVVAPDGKKTALLGALSYDSIKTVVDTLLNQISE